MTELNVRNTERLLARWRQRAVEDPDLTSEMDMLAVTPDAADVENRFLTELVFGTGGLRGVLGAGTNRMNIYTVRKATQGLADYLAESGDRRPVAIAYDSRMKSSLFAKEAARVLAANGQPVRLYPRLMPTPALSFAVRHLGCAAGICVTASHNPADYNGYKVYGPDGCQITTEAARAIGGKIAVVDPFDDVKLASYDQEVAGGTIQLIPEAAVDAFLEEVFAQRVDTSAEDTPIKVVYTPLNGAGKECVTRILGLIGVDDLTLVTEQADPDGRFPTCPYPNPENPKALELGLALCDELKADLLLATDPDCDRVGVAVREGDGMRLLTGNEVGVLLLDYLCGRRAGAGGLPQNPVVVSTIVSTSMADSIAETYGAQVRRTLTGFKYIGEQIGRLEEAGEGSRFVFGFEESCGYLSGGYVRDKDGVGACMLVCDMARWHKQQGRTLAQAVEALYERYGYYVNTLHSFTLEGVDGAVEMQAMMRAMRARPPQNIADFTVERVTDYLYPDSGAKEALPASDVLGYTLQGGCRVLVRPSGTEPKIKLYIETRGENRAQAARASRNLYDAMRALLLHGEGDRTAAVPPPVDAAPPLKTPPLAGPDPVSLGNPPIE